MEESPAQIDPLLEPLLLEEGGGPDDELLSTLPPNPHRTTQRDEAEDLYQEALLQLLTRLRQFRAEPRRHPIADLRGMAAVIAHPTCSGWMRRQFPERHALKNRLHYLLTRQKGFALWQGEDGKMLAGFAAWQGRKKAVPAARLGELSEVEGVRLLKGGRPQELADALAAAFEHFDGPVELDALVSALASLLGIRDRPVESLPENEDAPAAESDPAWEI